MIHIAVCRMGVKVDPWAKRIFGTSDLKETGGGPFVAAIVAEFLGTLFIVLFGCGSALGFVNNGDLVQIRCYPKLHSCP